VSEAGKVGLSVGSATVSTVADDEYSSSAGASVIGEGPELTSGGTASIVCIRDSMPSI